jgi:hypothetical protein
MKIRQVKGIGALAELSRKRLETSTFPSLEHARQQVQQLFPNHRVFKENGVISVEVRDRSFRVAVFQEETRELLHVPMHR